MYVLQRPVLPLGGAGGTERQRGLCAQPCRLAFRWPGDKKASHPLSLKDLSLAGQLERLKEMGVACLKLEGRMKRPEYVVVVTKIYATALKEGREPTRDELTQLEAAFSRQGFTQGYYRDQKGPAHVRHPAGGDEGPGRIICPGAGVLWAGRTSAGAGNLHRAGEGGRPADAHGGG